MCTPAFCVFLSWFTLPGKDFQMRSFSDNRVRRFWHYSSDCLFHKNLLSFHQFFFRTKVLLDILNRGISLTHHIKMHSVICKINLLLSSDTRSSICISTFSNVITLAKKAIDIKLGFNWVNTARIQLKREVQKKKV